MSSICRQIAALIAAVDARWFYVGLTDEAVEGDFRLPDGRLFNSADKSQMGKWYGREPNNHGDAEHFVLLEKHSLSLFDIHANNVAYGICEIPVYEC